MSGHWVLLWLVGTQGGGTEGGRQEGDEDPGGGDGSQSFLLGGAQASPPLRGLPTGL